ncbi:MAG: hypothetical protein AB1393_09525 [Candidatus Edwardsbacteria bacterium]
MKKQRIISVLNKIDDVIFTLKRMGWIVVDEMTLGEIKKMLLKQLGESVYKRQRR